MSLTVLCFMIENKHDIFHFPAWLSIDATTTTQLYIFIMAGHIFTFLEICCYHVFYCEAPFGLKFNGFI